MIQNELFRVALGMTEPWFVSDVTFDMKDAKEPKEPQPGELHISLDFRSGARFGCAQCGATALEVHDTMERTWQHLDFFQYRAWLHARVPRVRCGNCGVHLVSVPWARPGSGFTLLFEALALMLACQMPVSAASRQMRVSDTRIWRLLKAYVDAAREKVDMSGVETVAVDETSSRRGHTYVTIFVDPKPGSRKVLFVTPGKDHSTFDRFLEDLIAHGGASENVKDVVADMSPAFALGAKACFPKADLTHDKFHAVSLVSKAVDETRRLEVVSRPELKGARYVFLKNPLNLTDKQLAQWDRLKDGNLKTLKAYELYLAFRDIWDYSPEEAPLALGRWISWALRSRVAPMVKAAQTIRSHAATLLRVLSNDLTTAIMEGVNSLVQAAKARARGYRNVENFMTMIYLISGKLDLRFAHTK